MSRHEGNGLRGGPRGRPYEVSFVFPSGIVGYDDEFTVSDVCDNLFDRTEGQGGHGTLRENGGVVEQGRAEDVVQN